MAFVTGTSNYPSDFDLNPSGTGTTSTLSFVLDEIRDSNGVVIQSGNTVIARDVNVAYTVLNQVERTLGLDPEGNYPDVSARLNFMENSGNLAFVHVTGGAMLGPLVFPSGVPLVLTNLSTTGLNWVMSGNSTISSNGNISLSTTGNFNFFVGNITVTGSSVQLNTNSLTINGLTTVGNDIVPSAPSIDLGSTGSAFDTLYVNNIVSTGVTVLNNYVAHSGDSMFGNLNMTGSAGIVLGSGSNISVLNSGTSQMGSSSLPFGDVFTKTLHASFISGLSPVTLQSDLRFVSGASIGASGTGITIGSASNPISVIYASNVIGATGLDVNAVVAKSGSSIFGNITFSGNANLILNSGSNVRTAVSGVGNIGASGTPFAAVYANTINNRSQSNLAFNETLTGTTDGINKRFFFSNAPSVGAAMIFVSGGLILPTTQYIISGTSLYLTGVMYAPTTAPVAGFYLY